MPFFIFDGERIQQLAEANREGQMEQIEQLLDLADIDVLNEYLGKNLATWRRESKDAGQNEFNALKLDIQAVEERLTGFVAQQREHEEELAETEYQLKRLDGALQARRQFALQSDADQLAAKREGVAGRLEERTAAFFAAFSREAPLTVLPVLLGQAALELEKLSQHPNRRLRDELDRIFSTLPERLFVDPPHPVRGCKNFCVNGHPAGNCRIARSDDDRKEARRTAGPAGQPAV